MVNVDGSLLPGDATRVIPPGVLLSMKPNPVLVGSFDATAEGKSEPEGIVLQKKLPHQGLDKSNLPYELKIIRPEKLDDTAQGVVRLINLVNQQKVDRLFFLDKSARPVGYLFLKTWNYLFPDCSPPHISFIEIGRHDQLRILDRDYAGEISKVLIGRYTDLKDKTVCVVDEYVETGGTLIRSKKIFQKVFPNMKKLILTSAFEKCASWYATYGPGVEEYESSNPNRVFIVKPLARAWSEARNLREELDIVAQLISQNAQRTLLSGVDGTPYVPSNASAIRELDTPLNE